MILYISPNIGYVDRNIACITSQLVQYLPCRVGLRLPRARLFEDVEYRLVRAGSVDLAEPLLYFERV